MGQLIQHAGLVQVLAALSRRRMRLAPATGTGLHGSNMSQLAASAVLPTDVASIPILAASSASSPTAATINDFDAVLSLAEEMAGGSAPAVRSMAVSLYRILLRCGSACHGVLGLRIPAGHVSIALVISNQ